MIPDFEICECMEHKVKSKIGTIFVNEKILEEKSAKIYEIDPYFYEHYKKNKYKLVKMNVNTYYLEGHTNRDIIFEKKEKKHLKKYLTVNLLELILVEKIMMQTMKLVEYKALLVTLKTKKKKMK